MKLFQRLAIFVAVTVALAAWENPVLVPTTGQIRDSYVRLNSGNTAYIAYVEDFKVKLAKYDGRKMTFIGQVSDGTRQCYTPTIRFSADNEVHIVWGEALIYADADNSIMYRRFSETSGWSPIVQLHTYNIPRPHRKGPNHAKIEQLRFGLDKDNNIYIAFYDSPNLRCRLLSRYGEEVIDETWPDPLHVRTQTPDIVVDEHDVHATWTQFLYNLDGAYTIYYAKRPVGKANSGNWGSPVDIKSGLEQNMNVHRPRIALDENNIPYILYMQDAASGSARNMYIRYLQGSTFSGFYDLTFNNTKTYNNLNLEMAGAANILVVAHGAYNTFYNWRVNGVWSGLALIDSIPYNQDVECASLSADGSLALITYSPIQAIGVIYYSQIWLTSNQAWVANKLPLPVIESDVAEAYWKDTVVFDGGKSTDPDGHIVAWKWDFGDGETAEEVKVSHPFANDAAYGDLKVKFTVTDDKGATASATKVIKVKPLHAVIASSLNELFWRETVIFYGTNSVCADGSIVKYEWNFGDGETATGVQVAHQFASATAFGDLPVKLTVTDDKGVADSATKIIKVKPRPFPVIKSDKDEIFWQETVAFDGRSSLTVDSTIVAYEWNFGDGEHATGSQVTHKFANSKASGDLIVQLTVTNAKGVSAVASKTIKVKPRPFPVIGSNLDEIFWQDTVVFDGSKTLVLPGFTVRYGWDFGDGEYGEGMQVSHQFKNASAFGDKRVKLTVMDNKNASASASKTIKVKALYTAPFTFLKVWIRTISYARWGYKVSWTANAKNAAAGYNIVRYRIFRKPLSASADYSQVAEVDAAVKNYLDLNVDQAVEYVYAVCALDASGHVSPVNNL